MGEVLSVRRERCVSMTRYYQDPVPAPVPFWRKPVSIFGLVLITTFIKSFSTGHFCKSFCNKHLRG
jgi:hypothetical protein